MPIYLRQRVADPTARRKQTQSTYQGHPARSAFAWVVVAIATLAIVAFLATLFFHPYPYAMPMGYYSYPWFGWGFFPFGFIFFFIFVFFVFRFAFWGWGGRWRGRYYRYGYGDAKEILRQRYARGEVTKDQFEQMMRDLDQHQ